MLASLIKTTGLARMVVASVCLAVVALAGCTAFQAQGEKSSEVMVPSEISTEQSTIPPLDRLAPTEMETATFALG